MQNQPLIEFQQLQCERDGRTLFAGLNFVIRSGDIVQIEGPNGSGKTTLLRALTQLFPDYGGDILWQGKPIRQVMYDFRSHLVFIGHLPGIRKTLTPRENLRFLSSLQKECSLQAIDDALAHVGLYGYEDMPGYQLSAGQNRRIALARLYLPQTADMGLWVLDEPYTALDIQGIEKLEQRFADYVSGGGCIVMTSHQPPSIDNLRRLPLPDYRPLTQSVEVGE